MEQTEKKEIINDEDIVKSTINMESSVDVVIPVYKPDKKFNLLVERLVKQSVKPKHIFLLHTIEDNSNSASALTEACNLTSSECQILCIDINKKDFDHGGTRNYGASLSETDFVMFLTQDAVPVDRELMKNILKPFATQEVGAVYGRQLAGPKAGVIEAYTRIFNYPELSLVKSKEDIPELGIKTYFCSNVCAAYRKSVYDKLGGFVTKTIFNEDMIMAAGIINDGYSIAYAADAKVIHSHVYTYVQQFKRNFDLAVSQQQYKQIFDSVKSESEGMKLVIQTLRYLMDEKKYIYIPDLILQSASKYLGYKAGRHYEVLPKDIVKKLSMNPNYWGGL